MSEHGSERPLSLAASTGVTFAMVMLGVMGIFQAGAGLAAILNDEFFVVGRNYTFDLDITAWGWIHLLIGALFLFAGWGLFARRVWAGIVAIGVAVIGAVDNFFFIPYYPFWSILMIALACWVIWSLTRPGVLGSR